MKVDELKWFQHDMMKFRPIPMETPQLHAKYEECGVTFSILSGNMFYSDPDEGTYEIWAIEPSEVKEFFNEPLGWVTEEQINKYIDEVCGYVKGIK